MALRISQLETKPQHRLKAMEKKNRIRIAKLHSVLNNSKVFGIPLSFVSENAIREKVDYYWQELTKINAFWNYKFNEKYTGGLGNWAKEK